MIIKGSTSNFISFSADIDLINDLQENAKKQLTDMGYKDLNPKDYLNTYFNVKKRKIIPTPRTIHKSDVFCCPRGYESPLKEIEKHITNGDDLTPYMSKSIDKGDFYDSLLYDWNIQHLHLGSIVPSEKFVSRSNYLLFVFFTEKDAYFIQIYPHKEKYVFAKDEMMHIIDRNWSGLISRFSINGILSETITDKDRAMLRKCGISTFTDMGDGKIYGNIGGGYASNGISIEAVRNSMFWKNKMKDYQKIITDNLTGFFDCIIKNGKPISTNLYFKMLSITDDSIMVAEKNNHIICEIDDKKNRLTFSCVEAHIQEFISNRSYYGRR